MESVTKEGLVSVSLRFDWNADLRTIVVDVRKRSTALTRICPTARKKPTVQTEDLGSAPILTLAAFPAQSAGLGISLPLSGRTSLHGLPDSGGSLPYGCPEPNLGSFSSKGIGKNSRPPGFLPRT
jgi:hypothetical protein